MASKENPTIAAKQARFGATSALYTLVVLAILVLVNWLSTRYNKTYDTTSNKRYTLSGQTKKIVHGLKSDATITYFDHRKSFDQAQGILDRYANLSRKIHVQYVDPMQNPMLTLAYGVRTAGTAYVTIGQRREEAKSLTEEGITSAFVKDLKGVRKVCFVRGDGEPELTDNEAKGLSQLKTLLDRDNYDAEPVTLLDKSAAPGDCRVLVIAGPKGDYTSNEIAAVKTFVENGGSVLFALDPPLDLQHDHVSENAPLTGLLAGWGVTLDKDIVLEQNPEALTQDVGPLFPLVSNYESHPIVSDLKQFTGFAITRSLEVKNGDKTSVQKLFSSTDSAIASSKLSAAGINPQDPSNKHGAFVLAAAGTYNTGKPGAGRFAVFGTSRFLDNAETGIHFQGNRDLALNAVNWLAADEDLISIRPTEPEDRRLNMTQRQMNMFFYLDLIALPLLSIVTGVSILWKRR